MKKISFDEIDNRCRQSMMGRSADIEAPRYIFIGGSARTGTTLLQSIVCDDKTLLEISEEIEAFLD